MLNQLSSADDDRLVSGVVEVKEIFYHPDTPADTVLETHEWQALYCTIHQTPLPPDAHPSLRTCVRWVAQLGGLLGRKHDGEPGVKTIWQGLRRLHDIAQTWKLVSSTTSTCVKSSNV